MIERPRFKSHFRVSLVPPDVVILIGEAGYRVLQNPLIYRIAPYINGRNTSAQIAKRLRGKVSTLDVTAAILLLEMEGLLVDGARVPPASTDLLRDSWNVDPGEFAHRLRSRAVNIVSAGGIGADVFQSVLKSLGVKVSAKAAFHCVLTDDYLRPELEPINRRMLRGRTPWMLVKPTGSVLWIGPVFRPGRTACWSCLARRLERNREVEMLARRAGKMLQPAPGVFEFREVALHLAAVEALKAIVTAGRAREGPLLRTLDLRKMKLQEHAVQKLDDCGICGSRKQAAHSVRPVLKRRRAAFSNEGGYRTSSAEATFRRYQHLISPITGIVDQVEPYYTDEAGLLHSYAAGHLFVPLAGVEDLLSRGLKQVSMGKGMTPAQARTSALCEALERYSGVFRGDEPRIRSSFRELGDRVIHPNRCMNFSRLQYESRASSSDWIPEPFDELRAIEWAPVWSLTHKSFRYLPAAYCYYGYSVGSGPVFCRADSNGNAAGNTLEEAILQGFLELVERDAAALWWYNRVPRPGIEMESFGLPYVAALRDAYQALELDVWALDITTDFQIPVFAALASRRRSGRAEFVIGLGAHLDPLIALSRALTEMNQFLRGFLEGGSKRILRPAGRNLDFLRPSTGHPAVRLSDFAAPAGEDLRRHVLHCVRLAERLGLETLVLDQTRADAGMPVVKVFVPGLRQLWPRFGPGRLYETPVRLGWQNEPLQEKQLNRDRIVI